MKFSDFLDVKVICETGSLRKAAEVLGITQPTLSTRYIPSAEGLSGYLDSLSAHKEKLLKKGELAYRTYYDHLQYEKWCKWVIKELELI